MQMRHVSSKLAATFAVVVLMMCGVLAGAVGASPGGASGAHDSPGGSGIVSHAQNADPHLPYDPFDQRACLLPFPNDVFTVPDAAMPTGRRIALD